MATRLVCVFAAWAVMVGAFAQAPQPNWWDRVQTTYEKAVAAGRPVAEKFVRNFHSKFETLKKSTAGAIEDGRRAIDHADLKQKEAVALELWRVRQSLDLATLCSAPVIKQLTGLDVPTLEELKAKVIKLEAELQSQIGKFRHPAR